ncbi:MAG: type IV toxin-antitoxin system AbiEi family antitoxin domain-containing protein [Hyphomonadaceae bacterium]|nr:type IV toxin-antitoxin system AbiEi family antitoxin domain-containing protein [Hyphomonadaceae bacterium]
MTVSTQRSAAIALARRKTVARARDFDAVGVPRTVLMRLVDDGVLLRPSRGFYQLAGADVSATHSLAEASAAAPKGVVALLSALQFHGLTTQLPHEVWMLMPSKAWVPTSPPVRLRILRAGEEALKAGIQRHSIDGASVPITSPAKTIADCFKYRSRVGLDVAIEALRDGLKQRKATRADIQRYARICRVQNVMRPHLETLS